MVIDSSGNVGIGDTNPVSYGKFVVQGTGNIINANASSGAATFQLYEGGQGRFAITTLNGSAGAKFELAGSETMRITSAGGVSFGSTGTAYGTSGQVLTSAGNASPTWTTPTTGTVTGTGVAGEVAYWTSSTNIANNAGMSFSNQQVQLDGINGSDGFVLPYDQDPGYSNMSAGGFGILFREAQDNYITGNAYWYKTGGTSGLRAKYDAQATQLSQASGEFNFHTAPANGANGALTFTSRMIIKQSGNVGIGVTGPGAKLEVEGSTNAIIKMNSTTGTGGRMDFAHGGSVYGNVGSARNMLGVGNAADMMVNGDSVLYLGVGAQHMTILSSALGS
jgi:hypothetical protein